jgi:hypothetical protein
VDGGVSSACGINNQNFWGSTGYETVYENRASEDTIIKPQGDLISSWGFIFNSMTPTGPS